VTKLSLILLAVAAAIVFAGSSILDEVSEARPRISELLDVGGEPKAQSSSQLSAAEFLNLRVGTPRDTVRAVVGEPEGSHRVSIEGLEIDCWYYGVAGATGSYQLCFAAGRLRSKVGFGAAGGSS
jgi:hypothetical protein